MADAVLESGVDIKENDLMKLDSRLITILLKDMTTCKNLIWATDNYQELGPGYAENDHITVASITGKNGDVIKPRCAKSKAEQQNRIRQKAEVFTPMWICNAQNNLVDDAWFGYANVFNIPKGQTWESTEKIVFPSHEEYGAGSWTDYVKLVRMEIACGEAPYLVSRYDNVTGKYFPVKMRIGLLDRKLRIINEKVKTRKSWQHWAKKAVQSCYGYEWQGDNVFLARENILQTIIDYYKEKFKEELDIDILVQFAEIVAWNIWQMDGIKCVVPNSCHDNIVQTKVVMRNLFSSTKSGLGAKAVQESVALMDKPNITVPCPGCMGKGRHTGTYCKIKDWLKGHGKVIEFADLLKGENNNG